jgi:pimeloyl-[acyl-carrier protein] synthase
MDWRTRAEDIGAVVGGAFGLVRERLESGAAFYPLSARARRDPYPLYARLRSVSPVHRSRLVNGWILTRYADVNEVLRDPRFSSDEREQPRHLRNRRILVRAGVMGGDEPDRFSLVRLDGAVHERLRNLLKTAFAGGRIPAMRKRIEELTGRLLDQAERSGRLDVIRDLAYPLPLMVVAGMLGVPPEDHAWLKETSDQALREMGLPNVDDLYAYTKAYRELDAYFGRFAEQRRRDPKDDLISVLATAENGGARLTTREIEINCSFMLTAGHETTTGLIGNGLLALLRRPEEMAALREKPELLEGAVEELLRFDSPTQMTSRIASEATELGGKRIARGQELILLLGAANRDPAQFADPDRLDIRRPDNGHLAFGFGAHFCLGARLARLEGQIALSTLLTRYPRLRLAGEPVWSGNIVVRGLSSLPVAFD